MMRVHVECGRHPSALRRWFPAPDPDPFFEETVLTALHGDCWTSIVIEEDGHALRHAFAACAISTTGLFDIEPLVGYAGPLTTPGAPREFVTSALERYSAICRDNGIIAEVVRFNPLLQNYRMVQGLTRELILLDPKPVVYLRVDREDRTRMSPYPRSTRNMVRTGYRLSHVSVLEKTPEHWSRLRELLDGTLEANGAASHWQLPLDLWNRLQQHRRFMLFGAIREKRLVSAAIVLVHSSTWYYFLAAGVRESEARRGAANAIVDEVGRTAALAGASRFGLGGGRTAAKSDSLFRFKSSFGGDVLPFTVGLVTHDRAERDAFLRIAERGGPLVCDPPLFLRYRLAPRFAEGRVFPVRIRSFAGRTA